MSGHHPPQQSQAPPAYPHGWATDQGWNVTPSTTQQSPAYPPPPQTGQPSASQPYTPEQQAYWNYYYQYYNQYYQQQQQQQQQSYQQQWDEYYRRLHEYQQQQQRMGVAAPVAASTSQPPAGQHAPPQPPPPAAAKQAKQQGKTGEKPAPEKKEQWAWGTGKADTPPQLPVTISAAEGRTPVKFSLSGTSKRPAAAIAVKDDGAEPTKARSGPAYISVDRVQEAKKIEQAKQQQVPVSSWPPSLKDYVKRCFEQCSNDFQREQMHVYLKDLIAAYLAKEELASHDWSSHPYPEFIISMQRQEASEKRKRKLDDADVGFDSKRLQSRAARFGTDSPQPAKAKKSNKKKKGRINLAAFGGPSGDQEVDISRYDVRGTCQKLEKDYFRLTAAPDPSTVRPEHVLKKSLKHIKQQYQAGRSYKWICDQFKSIRQDLTVQRIQNEFTVEVYETHARIALENQDPNEFHQCQVQLTRLYDSDVSGHEMEFVAYRVLYTMFVDKPRQMNALLAELTEKHKSHPAIKHALDFRAACALGNFHRAFKLYQTTPNMGSYLIDFFVERLRKEAVVTIVRAYRPHIQVSVLSEWLAFPSEAECTKFLTGLDLTVRKQLLDTKSSVAAVGVIDNKSKFGPAGTS